jgi:large subunit ribosomal protein L21
LCGWILVKEQPRMYAIIQTGSKQYKVATDSLLDVEKLALRPRAKTLSLDKVLLVADGDKVHIGNPFLKDATVKAEVVEPLIKADKVISYKYRRRKNSRWKKGHRQQLTRIRIKEISI